MRKVEKFAEWRNVIGKSHGGVSVIGFALGDVVIELDHLRQFPAAHGCDFHE
jgi:hypothetical protein